MVSITHISINKDVDETVVSALIKLPGFEDRAWFRIPAGQFPDHEAAADAFFVLGLVLAMGTDGRLDMDVRVSKRLIYNADAVQSIIVGWYPKRVRRIDHIDVAARDVDKPLIQGKKISCFTGGVDSFDTLVRNRHDIDALLYVHGYDVPLHRTEIREATSKLLNEVAQEMGIELLEVSTNIRVFLNRAATWSVIAHGPALAAVGHLLSTRFGTLIIPASHTFADKYAWGSHPLLDHLWSSYRLSVVHDGAGSTRVQKTRRLAQEPAARDHLRVCWQNTGKYNCGKCSKCVRTMIALELTGVLADFKTFESHINLDDVRELKLTNMSGRSFVKENLDFATEQGHREIKEVLQAVIDEFDQSRSSVAQQKLATGKGKTSIVMDQTQLRAVEKRIAGLERKVDKLERLWPVRAWRKLRGRS